eukprot:1817134-Rhodomonas_salina.5
MCTTCSPDSRSDSHMRMVWSQYCAESQRLLFTIGSRSRFGPEPPKPKGDDARCVCNLNRGCQVFGLENARDVGLRKSSAFVREMLGVCTGDAT